MLKVKKMSYSNNQFSALDDTVIIARAAMMGVHIPDDSFDTIDILRELEVSRTLLHDKRVETNTAPITVNDGLGNDIPLLLTWDNENVDEDEPYILVQSRQKKKHAHQ